MRNTFSSLKEFFILAMNLLDNLCKPNPKYSSGPGEYELSSKRNKVFVIVYFFLLLVFINDIITNKNPVFDSVVRCIFSIVNIGVMFISCRYHPQIFKCYYNLTCLAYGHVAIKSGPEGICSAFIFIQIFPLFVHLMTGSFKHYIFQAIAQTILLRIVYPKPMEEVLAYTPAETVLKNMTNATEMTLIFQIALIAMMSHFLQRAYQQAIIHEKKKDEAENQKTFLLSFSHELRNLINSLTGNVKLASFEDLTGKAKELLNNAEVCGELLLHLINNILDTGKTQIGELEINPVPTKTCDSFERIWGICSELIRRKGLRGQMKVCRNIPTTLIIDNYRLTQIFLNLVGNSIKFTENGSVDICIRWISPQEEITEKCFQPYPFNMLDDQDEGLFEKQRSFSVLNQDYVCLTTAAPKIKKSLVKPAYTTQKGVLKMIVSDTGCGMTDEQTSQLFQKFTQVTSDVSKKKLGTGLGLFITKQLCEKMHGEVRVYSQKDKGSSFIFCIPTESVPDEHENLHDLEPLKICLAQKKIQAMIVDDDPFNQVVLKTYFEKLGIQVTDIATNGMEAYQKYLEHINNQDPLQVVAMDLDMPIMDGKEASRKIRDLEREKGINPCFLLIDSGNCVRSEINECMSKEGRIQANIFLKKPVNIEELFRCVSSHFLSK